MATLFIHTLDADSMCMHIYKDEWPQNLLLKGIIHHTNCETSSHNSSASLSSTSPSNNPNDVFSRRKIVIFNLPRITCT